MYILRRRTDELSLTIVLAAIRNPAWSCASMSCAELCRVGACVMTVTLEFKTKESRLVDKTLGSPVYPHIYVGLNATPANLRARQPTSSKECRLHSVRSSKGHWQTLQQKVKMVASPLLLMDQMHCTFLCAAYILFVLGTRAAPSQAHCDESMVVLVLAASTHRYIQPSQRLHRSTVESAADFCQK